MKHLRLGLMVIPGVLSLALVHCGSDATPDVLADGPDAADASSDGGAQGTDGGSTADAPGDAPLPAIPGGGAPPDPGKVSCGTATCNVPGEFCCLRPDGGGSCETSGGDCDALGGVRQRCNEKTDCPQSEVCCYEFDLDGGVSTACHLDCNGGSGRRVQACRTLSECSTGSCAVRTCDGGVSVESCGACP